MAEPITLRTGSEAVGQRLDAFLAGAVPELTRSAAQRLIGEGQVLVNGRAPAKSLKLSGGETVTVTLPEPEPIEAVAQDIPLDVVYEDEDVIVVNKPVGLVVHPAPGHSDGTLVNALLHHCGGSLSGVGGALRPGIVHRIDRDTSGLIIAAKNDFAHQALAAQLQDHTLARTYEAGGGGELSGGPGHRGRPHRPLPVGPEEDGGGGPGGQERGDPLGGCGAVSRLYPHPLPPGDRPDPPDPCPHGLHRPSPPGGTRCTGPKSRCQAWRASASTRRSCGSSTPAPESR